MKKSYTFLSANILVLFLFIGSVLNAQTPDKISYQAVVRDLNQQLISNTTLGMQISILVETPDGTVVYAETQSPQSNNNGLVSIEIGTGTSSDEFSSINWAMGLHFIKIEIDLEGGSAYTINSTSQLLSVPYALHAKTADNVFSGDFYDLSNVPTGIADGDDNTQLDEASVDAFTGNNGYITAEVDGSTSNEIQALSISNDTIFLSNGGFAKLPTNASFSGAFTDLSNIPTGLADGDDDTQLTEAEVDAFAANNGYLTAEVDGSISNEIQALSISNDTIFLSNGGFAKLPANVSFSGSFSDLSNLPTGLADGDDNTQLTEAQVDGFANNNGYLTSFIEVDGSVTNEIELPTQTGQSGKVLSTDGTNPSWVISNAGSFSDLTDIPTGLSDGDDNTQLTEAQVLSYVSTDGYIKSPVDRFSEHLLRVNATGDGYDWVHQSVYTKLSEGEVDSYVNNNGYLTAEVDASITNEIQDLQLSGNNLTITNNGTATTIDLSPYLVNTNTQLNETQVDSYVANNGYLTSFTEVDGSITNEIELPSQTGNSGKVLSTNGSSPSWINAGGSTSVRTISANTTLTTSDEIVIINGAFTATFPASPTDGMKLTLCSATASAGINGNGKLLHVANVTLSSLTFSDVTSNVYIFIYSSTIGGWLGLY